MGIKIIITGSTGMVGEGVLFECLQNSEVDHVLIVNRKHYNLSHPKLSELIIPDFFKAEVYAELLKGYDGCFYCAGVSSIGKNEAEFKLVIYDTTLRFANVLLKQNPEMVFDFVTGKGTDSSEKGKLMWARVKGRTENDLMKLPFRKVYNFRPGIMTPMPGQKNVKYKWIIGIAKYLLPKQTLTLKEVGIAMINTVTKTFPKQVLEIKDIRELAKL